MVLILLAATRDALHNTYSQSTQEVMRTHKRLADPLGGRQAASRGGKKSAKSCLGGETCYTGQVLHIEGRSSPILILGNVVDSNSAHGSAQPERVLWLGPCLHSARE